MSESPLPPAVESMTLLVAAVIVHDQVHDNVLLLQRGPSAKFAPGQWDIPVGKANPGEAITTAAVRELAEETGVIVEPEALEVVHVIHGAWGVEAPNGFLTVVFAARKWSGEPVNAEPHKHAQVRWVPATQVPVEFVSTTRTALVSYLGGGNMVSTEGW